ncbi:MAG: dipeptide ABC transporter ATP-binding protein [Gammaproteobacteria bacterium]
MNSATPDLLTIDDLTIEFRTPGRDLLAVKQLGMTIRTGETLVLLGESGSGKSVTALAIMGLLPSAGSITSGNINFDGEELTRYSNAAMRNIRGRRIGMVFQEPMTSLNPVMTVGKQIVEALPAKLRRAPRRQIREQGVKLLAEMGIPEPQRRFDEFPHQLSGGMKQRVMIAIALAGEPDLLIADEPTTALDVTTQAQILELLRQRQRARNMAMLLVTHDFGIAAQMADRVLVMRAGEIVETADSKDFFQAPKHPYSQQLFAALPNLNKRGKSLSQANQADEAGQVTPSPMVNSSAKAVPQLTVSGLQVRFDQGRDTLFGPRQTLHAVDGVSFSLNPGETLAIVGESGCGKSTVIKSVLQLIRPSNGSVLFDDTELTGRSQRQLRPLRRHLQVVFQDPYSSLNPRMRVNDIIQEGMIAQKMGGTASQREDRVKQLLEDVGLDPDVGDRYPHEFSGGQRQRIGIARALAVEPRVLLLDEPTSALDLSVQAQILDLLKSIQRKRDLAYIFVTHDLSVVEYFADWVAVMYLGRIVEEGPAVDLMTRPGHPYTQALLASAPAVSVTANQNRPAAPLPGEPPSPLNRPGGCHFHPRCTYAEHRCSTEYPAPSELTAQHRVSCHYPQSIPAAGNIGTDS